MSMFIHTRSLLQSVFRGQANNAGNDGQGNIVHNGSADSSAGPSVPLSPGSSSSMGNTVSGAAASQSLPATANGLPSPRARSATIFPHLDFSFSTWRRSTGSVASSMDVSSVPHTAHASLSSSLSNSNLAMACSSSGCPASPTSSVSSGPSAGVELPHPMAVCRICFDPLDSVPSWTPEGSPCNSGTSDSDRDEAVNTRQARQSGACARSQRSSSSCSASHGNNGPLYVAPCACAGTQRYVHTACLEHWRKRGNRTESYSRCDICKTPYSVQIVHVPTFSEFIAASPFLAVLFPLFCQCLSVASFASLLMFSSMYVVLKGVVYALAHVCDPDGLVFKLLLFEMMIRVGVRRFTTHVTLGAALFIFSLHLLFGVPLLEAIHMLAVILPSARAFWSRADIGLGFGSSFLKHCSSSLAVGVLAGLAAFGIELLRQFRTFQKTHTRDRVLDYVPRKLMAK